MGKSSQWVISIDYRRVTQLDSVNGLNFVLHAPRTKARVPGFHGMPGGGKWISGSFIVDICIYNVYIYINK